MDERETLRLAAPPLLDWFRLHRRDLPWRKNRTPYTVLVSELMLQQTRVEAVKERYVAFLEAFPTAESLAAAPEEDVMKAWEGLGYYSRARNLHAAAKIIAREGFPQTWVGVRALPGVGDYTAGAVSSIALGLGTPAVDGNVLRILTRLFADPRNVDEMPAKKYFSALLADVYPPEAGEFTEALMELGAIVCTPNGPPTCGACPWSTLCKAHLSGRETAFPVRSEKRARRVVFLDVYVLKAGDRYALERRTEGLLAGLYGFPAEVSSAPRSIAPRSSPSESTAPRSTAPEPSKSDPSAAFPATAAGSLRFCGTELAVKKAKHVFTHIEWHMTGHFIEVSEVPAGYLWATAEEIRRKYAIPSAFRAFRTWLA